MVRRVGWKKGEGAFYTRYKIPFDTLSGIERVKRFRGRSHYRVAVNASGRPVKGTVELPFQSSHGSDAAIRRIPGGVKLERFGVNRHFTPQFKNPKLKRGLPAMLSE